MPSNAYDAKGLMQSAIADGNPLEFMFHKAMQGMGWLGTVPGSIVQLPPEMYEVPIGKAAKVRLGRDITLVGLGLTLHLALQAAATLAAEGIEAEVIDLPSIAPLDHEAIAISVAKTRRLIAVDDDYRSFGVSAEIIAGASEVGVDWLSAPARITHPDVPIPYSPALEHPLLPSASKIVEAARRLCRGKVASWM